MNIITGAKTGLPNGLYDTLGIYRHAVFVQTLGWNLDTLNGCEEDQFDRPDTEYVAAINKSGQMVGCARLLPTHKPYLLGEVFPELLNGQAIPQSPDIWELSRFAAMDLTRNAPPPSMRHASPIAINLLRCTLQRAAELGAASIIAVITLGVERLMKCAKFNVIRVAPPSVFDGHPLVACWIDLSVSPN